MKPAEPLEQRALRIASDTDRCCGHENGPGSEWAVEFARRLTAEQGEPVAKFTLEDGCLTGSTMKAGLTGEFWVYHSYASPPQAHDAQDAKCAKCGAPSTEACNNKACPQNAPKRPKIVCLCGSTRFIRQMACVQWGLERDEGYIVIGMHLLPDDYPGVQPDHMAEHEGFKEHFDELHKRKIDLAD